MITLGMLIEFLESMHDRDAVHEAILEQLRNYDRLRTHHAHVEAEVMQLRKGKTDE